MTALRVHHTNKATTAHPPLTGVKPTSQWLADRLATRRPWWRKLFPFPTSQQGENHG